MTTPTSILGGQILVCPPQDPYRIPPEYPAKSVLPRQSGDVTLPCIHCHGETRVPERGQRMLLEATIKHAEGYYLNPPVVCCFACYGPVKAEILKIGIVREEHHYWNGPEQPEGL